VILVAGGTGRLGSLIVRRLQDGGSPVRVLTRNAGQARSMLPARVDLVTGDVRDPGTLMSAVSGASVVVSAVQGFAGGGGSPASVDRDGNRHLVDAAHSVGADVVLMSVVGAAPDSPMELFRMKYAAEQHLRQSGVPFTIVRATAFLELWTELLRKTAGRSGRPVVFGHGENPINFVSVGDVAALVEHVVSDRSSRGTVQEIGGPENLTLNELAAAVQVSEEARMPRHVPVPVLRFLGGSVGRLRPELGRQTRAAVAMDRMDLAFDRGGGREAYPDVPCTSVGATPPT
jgi:NADH dehydrogenase